MSEKSNEAFWEWHAKQPPELAIDPLSAWRAALAWARPQMAAKIQELKAKKDKRGKFSPPTEAEIYHYMRQLEVHDAAHSAKAFIDYHEERGWIPKGCARQMKSWKAAVRTWKRNQGKFGEVKTSAGPDFLEEMRNWPACPPEDGKKLRDDLTGMVVAISKAGKWEAV